MKRLLLLSCLLSSSVNAQYDPTHAPPPQQSGWARFGAAMGSSKQAYERGQMQALDTQIALAERDKAVAETQALQYLIAMRQRLYEVWRAKGLEDGEARAVANTYNFQDTQDAVVYSVRHEGVEKAGPEAFAAYQKRDFQTANELLIAILIILHEQDQARPKPAIDWSEYKFFPDSNESDRAKAEAAEKSKSNATPTPSSESPDITQARKQLNAYETFLIQTDPSYESKRARLYSLVKSITEKEPPSQWLQATERAYQSIGVATTASDAAKATRK